MKKSKATILTIIGAAITTLVSCSAMGNAFAYKCPAGTLRAGDEVESATLCNVDPGGNTFTSDLTNIINWIVGVAGLVAVVVVIIGGVTYMTSNGDPGKVKKGKDTILYGIIGLIICVLAFAIVNFVIANVIG